nr:MAG TPA: RNA-directed RNA polymerase catalytic subunit [Bacteriophage sp.]
MLYKVLLRMVAKGMGEELRDKIDTLYALGRLSDAQYRELIK